MLVKTDHRLFYRSVFTYSSNEQRERVMAWLDALERKVYCRPNRYASKSLVCDFESPFDRNKFDEARSEF